MQELTKEYSTSGIVRINEKAVPILAIPMITDEHWNELTRENAVNNYVKQNGKEPESVEVAVQWQREWSKILILELCCFPEIPK